MNRPDGEKEVHNSAPFVTGECKSEEDIFNLDKQPPVSRISYSCETGSFLHFFRPPSQKQEKRSIFCYSPWSVTSDDECSLMAWVEVEDDEKEFSLAICGENERVEGNFLQYFASEQTMRPMEPQEIRRLCICPWHRRALMLDPMENKILSCVHLPSEGFCRHRMSKCRGAEANISDSVNAIDTWRVVVEHKGHGFNSVKYKPAGSSIMRRALVFSGQGSHRQGMSMEFLCVPEVARLWERMKSRMEQNYGLSIQNVITENPQKIQVFDDALDVTAICSRSCHADRNAAESTPRTKTISHPEGVISLTYLAQPCILAAQMMALEYLKVKRNISVDDATVVAGHSMGEFSALCALGVFPPDVAVDLVYKRGVLMEDALNQFSVSRDNYLMYACNPTRAKLDEDDMDVAVDKFHILVELVARALSTTTSFVEVVDYNVDHEQYIVAGDLVGLSALGKCLDPQFRASSCGIAASLDHIATTAVSSVWQDKVNGVTMQPNLQPPPDFVTSAVRKYGIRSTFRRFMRGPDDGHTPSLSELTSLTLQEDGRSGLKKKSWFLPLAVRSPFHSSLLRRAMGNFFSVVREALPEEKNLRGILGVDKESPKNRPMWVTNLTGRVFRPFDADFQREAIDIMQSMNVGEVRHNGRYHTDFVENQFRRGIAEESVRDMCAAVLAAQLAHPVQWIDVMDVAVLEAGCRVIHEISPVRITAEMFKRTVFRERPKVGQEGQESEPLQITTRCLPSEERFL